MRKIVLTALLATGICQAQSVVQTINSGSLITAASSVSIGEIVVVPENPVQSASGLIGILAQHQDNLEVPSLELAGKITVYPNPTASKIFFSTEESLMGTNVSIINTSGQVVAIQKISGDNSLDLEMFSSGIYLIQFTDKKSASFKIIKR